MQIDGMKTEGERQQLSLVIFTAGELTPGTQAFFARLAGDSAIALKAIIVDDYQRPLKSLPIRIIRQVRKQGIGWIPYKARSVIEAAIKATARKIYDALHAPNANLSTYDDFSRTHGVPVLRVVDVHSDESLNNNARNQSRPWHHIRRANPQE